VGSPQTKRQPPVGTVTVPVTIRVGALPGPGMALTQAAQLLEPASGQF
jgi:hypothetical protein